MRLVEHLVQAVSLAAASSHAAASASPSRATSRSLLRQNSSPSKSWAMSGRNARSLQKQHLVRETILYCRSGYYLQIRPDGSVSGTTESHPKFGILEFLTLSTVFLSWPMILPNRNSQEMHSEPFAIRNSASNMWLCMNSVGTLYGSKKRNDECIFKEMELKNFYSAYYSTKYPTDSNNKGKKWFIALDKDGKPKRARRKHKVAQFIPRAVRGRDPKVRYDSLTSRSPDIHTDVTQQLIVVQATQSPSSPKPITDSPIVKITRRGRKRKGNEEQLRRREERKQRRKQEKRRRKQNKNQQNKVGKKRKHSKSDLNLYDDILKLLDTRLKRVMAFKTKRLKNYKRKHLHRSGATKETWLRS